MVCTYTRIRVLSPTNSAMNAHITQTLQTSCDIDPLRYGWSIGGGIVDVLTPYEVRLRQR